MQDFHNYITKIKDEKLVELEEGLKQENESSLSVIKEEISKLTVLLDKVVSNRTKRETATKEFILSQVTAFELGKYVNNEIAQLVRKIVLNYFKDSKHLEIFILHKISELKDKYRKLTVKYGKSATLAKSIFKGWDKVELEKDDSIEDGVIIETEDYIFDATVETYIKKVTKELRDAIYKLINK